MKQHQDRAMNRVALSTSILTLSLFAALPIGASAQETPVQACDKLAAHPADPDKPTHIEGTRTGTIEVGIAIDACARAIVEEPNNVRMHYQLGRAFYDKEDYASAFREFSIASSSGYAAAKGALGFLHDQALGTVADKAKAIALYREASDGNVAFAAHNLGVMLREGDGVPIDYASSLAYFRKAVDLGYRQSLVDIGFAYDNGYAVTRDHVEAVRWYRLAAQDNTPEALNNLGSAYENGEGVPQDLALAMSWYKKAQAQDYSLAFINMSHMIDSGEGVPADPKVAADYIFQALEKGGADDDAFNIKYMFEEATWTPAFWKEVQTRLAASHGYEGMIDGTPSAETRAAVEVLMDQ
jgi:TPR repeat protein